MSGRDEEGEKESSASPTHSQQTISDDEEIDYSVKPQFYDEKLDERDELWVQKQRRRSKATTDAVLTCPACFTTLCFDCQRHEKYVTQYRAMFVVNCKIKEELAQMGSKRKRNQEDSQIEESPTSAETFRRVCCSVCSTEVGVFDEEEVYHFLNVLPSEG